MFPEVNNTERGKIPSAPLQVANQHEKAATRTSGKRISIWKLGSFFTRRTSREEAPRRSRRAEHPRADLIYLSRVIPRTSHHARCVTETQGHFRRQFTRADLTERLDHREKSSLGLDPTAKWSELNAPQSLTFDLASAPSPARFGTRSRSCWKCLAEILTGIQRDAPQIYIHTYTRVHSASTCMNL